VALDISRDNGGDNNRKGGKSISLSGVSLTAEPAHWTESAPPFDIDDPNQNPYSNIGPLSPLFKAASQNVQNLPPLHVLKSSPPIIPLASGALPSLSTLFGKGLLNTSPSPRYPPSMALQRDSHASGTPFLLPHHGTDSYNPLNASSSSNLSSPSPPMSSHYGSHSNYAKKEQTQPSPHPMARSNHIDGSSAQTNSSLRFPLSDTLNSLSAGVEHNRFGLLEQPNEIQRKSYKNESRYLLPNPLTVCLRNNIGSESSIPTILDGSVNVRIINADGNELPSTMQNILESLGGLTRPLDEERSASFSLKVSATSIGSMYRLLFTVTYRIKGSGSFTETILSNPFSVCSNRKKQLKELKERLNQMQRKA